MTFYAVLVALVILGFGCIAVSATAASIYEYLRSKSLQSDDSVRKSDVDKR